MSRLEGYFRHFASRPPRGWSERLLLLLLAPAGSLYGWILSLRAVLYRRGMLRRYSAGVPVISVGNLAVGGTGKTPLVDHLLRHLLQRGVPVAVVSRGYGSSGQGVRVVSAGSGPLLPPELCGDEPYLLARRNPHALVVVAPKRSEGVRLAVEELKAGAIILDDGFQHLAVERDLDIVLLDAEHPFGNGHVLPAGLLRERRSALERAGLCIFSRCRQGGRPAVKLPRPVLHCRHRLAQEAVTADGGIVPLGRLAGKKVVAFAGIAGPESFFADLEKAGVGLAGRIVFPDHCGYGPVEMNQIREAAQTADYLLTTEKDGVKLLGASFPAPCLTVGLTLEFFEQGAIEQAVDRCLSQKRR